MSPLTCAFRLERVTGIEPALSAWEADVLPLNYTRAHPHRRAGAVLIVTAPRLLGLDVRVDRVRDRPVSALDLMLVDHRGPIAVVPLKFL